MKSACEPATFPPTTSASGWRAAGQELERALAALALRAEAELGSRYDLGSTEPKSELDRLCATCLMVLEEGEERATGEARTSRPGDVARLLSDAIRLTNAVSERTMVRRARQLAECERGLARLRAVTTTAALIDGVCDELSRSLGFRRCLLGRVEAGTWRPWRGNAAMLPEDWVPDWMDRPIPLDDLALESRLLRERLPGLVLDTNVPGIAQMVHQSSARSYVGAPIMPAGQVVGFFHADHGPHGRLCDEADRDALWTFAEGFGHLYERTTLREQLRARREQVRVTFAELAQGLDGLVESELTLVQDLPRGRERPVLRPGPSDRLGQLTPRELEVLELIAAGARNSEIAERLAITVGTVKSHVKNLLPKLGVLNRSQAIALYLGADGP